MNLFILIFGLYQSFKLSTKHKAHHLEFLLEMKCKSQSLTHFYHSFGAIKRVPRDN
jgi:hypothetical protein